MCLILFALDAHPQYRLILLANRDEFYERPTQKAHFWAEAPHILAGKDLKAGGTWVGITKSGKFAALTNYRDPTSILTDAPSRGSIPANFLQGNQESLKYLMKMQFEANKYNGFNLLLAGKEDFFYYSNQEKIIKKLDAGVYGLSNHLLNTEWYKVRTGKKSLQNYVESNQVLNVNTLFDILKNTTKPSDEQLPNTGVPLEWERTLSSMFIESSNYGTCCSTVLLWDIDNQITFAERSHQTKETQIFEFAIGDI